MRSNMWGPWRSRVKSLRSWHQDVALQLKLLNQKPLVFFIRLVKVFRVSVKLQSLRTGHFHPLMLLIFQILVLKLNLISIQFRSFQVLPPLGDRSFPYNSTPSYCHFCSDERSSRLNDCQHRQQFTFSDRQHGKP